MKTIWMSAMWALVLLLASERAHAFYNPTTGRWLNRDPLNEPGFEAVRGVPVGRNPRLNLEGASTLDLSALSWSSRRRVGDGQNLYASVKNNPGNAIDPSGLKCVLMSNGMVADTDKGNVVFWSSDPVATARFINECNFKKKLPLLGACLIFLGGGPGAGVTICHKTEDWIEVDPLNPDTAERLCKYRCNDGHTYVGHGTECDSETITQPSDD